MSTKKEKRKEMKKSDKYWKENLTKEQYRVLRKKGTEPPFSGEYWDNHKDGAYKCAGCGTPLFKSDAKFESGSGWPSFYEALDPEKIEEREDRSLGMRRTEVLCRNCGGHLGHKFNDGPQPTGCRYCINSVSLDFDPV